MTDKLYQLPLALVASAWSTNGVKCECETCQFVRWACPDPDTAACSCCGESAAECYCEASCFESPLVGTQ